MSNRYLVEEGYFGVWEPFKSFRFYWTATRAKKKFDHQYKLSFSEFRIIDSKTGEIV